MTTAPGAAAAPADVLYDQLQTAGHDVAVWEGDPDMLRAYARAVDFRAVTKVTTCRNGKLNVSINGGFCTTLAPDLTHLAGAYLTPDQLAAVAAMR